MLRWGGSFLIASPPQQHLALWTLSLLSCTPSQTLYKVTDQKKNTQKVSVKTGDVGFVDHQTQKAI